MINSSSHSSNFETPFNHQRIWYKEIYLFCVHKIHSHKSILPCFDCFVSMPLCHQWKLIEMVSCRRIRRSSQFYLRLMVEIYVWKMKGLRKYINFIPIWVFFVAIVMHTNLSNLFSIHCHKNTKNEEKSKISENK